VRMLHREKMVRSGFMEEVVSSEQVRYSSGVFEKPGAV
jgi:hypothetical protein